MWFFRNFFFCFVFGGGEGMGGLMVIGIGFIDR